MAQSKHEGDLLVLGTLTPTTLNIPAGTVNNAAVGAAAAIVATKMQHQHSLIYSQADGTDVAAAIVPIWIVRGVTAEVIDVEVVCLDSPTGGDKTFTVDLGKSNAASPAPATILTGVRTYPAETADSVVLTATIADGDLLAGDTLTVTVAPSGSTGTQGQGLIVTVTIREDAE